METPSSLVKRGGQWRIRCGSRRKQPNSETEATARAFIREDGRTRSLRKVAPSGGGHRVSGSVWLPRLPITGAIYPTLETIQRQKRFEIFRAGKPCTTNRPPHARGNFAVVRAATCQTRRKRPADSGESFALAFCKSKSESTKAERRLDRNGTARGDPASRLRRGQTNPIVDRSERLSINPWKLRLDFLGSAMPHSYNR